MNYPPYKDSWFPEYQNYERSSIRKFAPALDSKLCPYILSMSNISIDEQKKFKTICNSVKSILLIGQIASRCKKTSVMTEFNKIGVNPSFIKRVLNNKNILHQHGRFSRETLDKLHQITDKRIVNRISLKTFDEIVKNFLPIDKIDDLNIPEQDRMYLKYGYYCELSAYSILKVGNIIGLKPEYVAAILQDDIKKYLEEEKAFVKKKKNKKLKINVNKDLRFLFEITNMNIKSLTDEVGIDNSRAIYLLNGWTTGCENLYVRNYLISVLDERLNENLKQWNYNEIIDAIYNSKEQDCYKKIIDVLYKKDTKDVNPVFIENFKNKKVGWSFEKILDSIKDEQKQLSDSEINEIVETIKINAEKWNEEKIILAISNSAKNINIIRSHIKSLLLIWLCEKSNMTEYLHPDTIRAIRNSRIQSIKKYKGRLSKETHEKINYELKRVCPKNIKHLGFISETVEKLLNKDNTLEKEYEYLKLKKDKLNDYKKGYISEISADEILIIGRLAGLTPEETAIKLTEDLGKEIVLVEHNPECIEKIESLIKINKNGKMKFNDESVKLIAKKLGKSERQIFRYYYGNSKISDKVKNDLIKILESEVNEVG